MIFYLIYLILTYAVSNKLFYELQSGIYFAKIFISLK